MSISQQAQVRSVILPVVALSVATLTWTLVGMSAAESTSLRPDSLLPPLAQKATLEDALPPDTEVNDLVLSSGIDRGSTRRVMATAQADVWVATAGDAVCMIAAIPGPENLVGSACTSPLDFERLGTGLALQGADGSVELHLVPADATLQISDPGPRQGISYEGLVRRPVTADPGGDGFGREALID